MKALVTGASGFIGRRLIAALLKKGISPTALVLSSENVKGIWPGRVRIARGDVTVRESLRQVFSEVDTVFHLAAVVSDWGDPVFHTRVTAGGTINVLSEAVRVRARVVLASSVVVYGDAVGRDVCDESHPFGFSVGPYSASKQLQEKLAWEFAAGEKLKLTVVRPTNVYGPLSKPWVHDVVAQLKSGLPCLVSGGEQNAGLCHVDNLVALLMLAATRKNAVGRIYNAADGSEVTWKRYFSDIARVINSPAPRSVPRLAAEAGAYLCENFYKTLRLKSRPPLTREALNLVGSHHRVPIDRARRELDYEPRVDYQKALREIAQHLRNC